LTQERVAIMPRVWLFVVISGITIFVDTGCSSQPKAVDASSLTPGATQEAADKQPSWNVPGTSRIVVGGPSTDSG
jgi:hypothetical protein